MAVLHVTTPELPPSLRSASIARHELAGTEPAAPEGAAASLAGDASPTADAAPDADALVRQALELPRLTITRMAAELGVPRGTLEAYRLGARRMPAPARARLADYLDGHAEALRALAGTLRTASRPDEARRRER